MRKPAAKAALCKPTVTIDGRYRMRRPPCRPPMVRAGSRLCGCPRPMRRRLAPKKSADPALPHTSRCGRALVFFLCSPPKTCISLVKSPSGGLGPKARRSPGRLCRALRMVFWAWDTVVAYPRRYPILPVKRSLNLSSLQSSKKSEELRVQLSSERRVQRA